MRTPLKASVKPLALAAATVLTVAACAPATTQQAEVPGTPGPPGSIEFRNTWAPGYHYDPEDQGYHRIRPAK